MLYYTDDAFAVGEVFFVPVVSEVDGDDGDDGVDGDDVKPSIFIFIDPFIMNKMMIKNNNAIQNPSFIFNPYIYIIRGFYYRKIL